MEIEELAWNSSADLPFRGQAYYPAHYKPRDNSVRWLGIPIDNRLFSGTEIEFAQLKIKN